MVVCVVVGFLLAAQLRDVKLAGRPTPPTPAA